uniref:Uncharacterized protein n=1 Tax=Cacopsylla melanoneura TaxID=428564 RepID=A0A8D8PWE4_9HEMI
MSRVFRVKYLTCRLMCRLFRVSLMLPVILGRQRELRLSYTLYNGRYFKEANSARPFFSFFIFASVRLLIFLIFHFVIFILKTKFLWIQIHILFHFLFGAS